jgi:hypothetical protein
VHSPLWRMAFRAQLEAPFMAAALQRAKCGRAACASRSSCGAASGKEIGCDFLRTSGPRVTSSGSSAATSVPCRLTLEPDGPARDFNLASIGAARRLA